MKNEIIYTDDYALIVSDEHIKDVRPHKGKYHLEDGLTINKFPDYLTDLGACKLIIAHRPLTDAPILEGVPLLPEFSQEDDVVELALRTYPFGNSERNALIAGYNKAKETYKYTEEDLRKAIDMATTRRHEDTVLFFRSDEIIQSLQQPKRPKYFETVCDCQECGANKTDLSLDMGCENKIATITNSQGQTELVGEYIY
jgi:hypothetical protein